MTDNVGKSHRAKYTTSCIQYKIHVKNDMVKEKGQDLFTHTDSSFIWFIRAKII
jgi:hypothetical protein